AAGRAQAAPLAPGRPERAHRRVRQEVPGPAATDRPAKGSTRQAPPHPGRLGGALGRDVPARRSGAAARAGSPRQAGSVARGENLMRTSSLPGLPLAAGLCWCVVAVADAPPPDKLERKARPPESKKADPTPPGPTEKTKTQDKDLRDKPGGSQAEPK